MTPWPTGRVQHRVRLLPARVVVYLLLAGCLFAELGYGQVWQRLTAGLHGFGTDHARRPALCGRPGNDSARRRCGRCSICYAARPRRPRPGRVLGRVLLAAIDGTLLASRTARERGRLHRQRCVTADRATPDPPERAVACGTRSVIDAVFDPASIGEVAQAARSARPAGRDAATGRPQLLCRDLITAIAATGAHCWSAARTGRRLPVLARYPDGSYLSNWAAPVRVIEAQITSPPPPDGAPAPTAGSQPCSTSASHPAAN